MACAAVAVTPTPPPIHYCPPGSAKNSVLQPYVLGTAKLPVHVESGEGGSFRSSGFAFEDLSGVNTHMRKLANGRRLETPAFVLNRKTFARVLVSFLERRAFSGKVRIKIRGSLRKRLQAAQAKIREKRDSQIRALEKLCKEYLALKHSPEPDAQQLKLLQAEIQGHDSYLAYTAGDDGGLWVVHEACRLYWCVGLTSPQVADELSVHACWVRQTLLKISRHAQELLKAPAPKRRAKKPPAPRPPRLCRDCGVRVPKRCHRCAACSKARSKRLAKAREKARVRSENGRTIRNPVH
jgi:hypothetical protein